MTFGECLTELVNGRKRAARAAWDEELGEYIAILNERLMIYKPEDEKFHPLVVSVGDITGNDWIVTERGD